MNLFRRLLALTSQVRLAMLAAVLSGLLAGWLVVWQAASLSRILGGVFLEGEKLSSVQDLLWLILLIGLLRGLLAWGIEVSSNFVAVRLKNHLRQRMFDKILKLGPTFTRKERTGELINAAVEGVEALDAYFSQYLPQLFIAALVPLSILVVVFPRDPLSGFVLLLTAPLIPLFLVLIGKTAEKITNRQWELLSHLSAHFFDSLQGLTTLKEFGRSRQHACSIAETSNRFRDTTLIGLRITFLSALVLELVATLSTAVVAVEVGLRLLYGQLAFQQAFFLLLLAPEFYLPLRMLGLRFHAGMAGTTAARRVFEILDIQEPGSESSQSGVSETPVFSTLSLSGLSFTYPGEIRPALRDITLKIHSGQHVALVGSSGAGKSTLAALLLRFIHPLGGSIYLNNELISKIALESWRNLVAWVPQNPHLFHDTVSANLLLARPDATAGQLAAAARAAHLDLFIQSLPQGYETVIGEQGARLSSGQAQRLALARAFLKNAPILILDEPTSSLDPQEEELVESAMHELMHGRTVITIAHRLNTVFQAHRIFVLDQGCLVEEGTHHQLMINGGVYSRLVGAAGQLAASPRFQVHQEIQESGSPLLPVSTLEVQANVNRQPSIIRLLGFLRSSWGWVALSVLLGVFTVGSNVGLMGASAFLVSAAALHPQLGTLQVVIVAVRFFGIVRGVFRYFERLASHNVTLNLLARLRIWFFQALEPLAPARLMQYRSADLLSRIMADVDALQSFYVRSVAPPLVAAILATGMTFFFAHYDQQLAWIYLAIMLLMGVGLPLLSWVISHHSGTALVASRVVLQTSLADGILGLADILVFGRGKDYSKSLASKEITYGKNQRQLASRTGYSNALTTIGMTVGMLAVLVTTIPLVAMGQVPGVMLAVLTLSVLAGFEAVVPLPHAAQVLSSSLQSARRLFEIVDCDPLVRESPSIARQLWTDPPTTDHELRVANLTFKYPGQLQPALQQINFQLPPGKRMAIVGPSGAGKSTLAYLLMRFWDISPGRIFLDGRDLREFSQEDVRQMLSYVSQRTYFFNDTIRQNLLLARPRATDAEIQAAAQKAQIHDFIIDLQKGYETIIGERGFRLSAGERQRLAIARALLKDAPIFLLDEPTANLDPLIEKQFLEMLFQLTIDRSLLLITHRLVGLENMDEILVLDKGSIVEKGSHSALLTGRGLYQHLLDSQNRILFARTGS